MEDTKKAWKASREASTLYLIYYALLIIGNPPAFFITITGKNDARPRKSSQVSLPATWLHRLSASWLMQVVDVWQSGKRRPQTAHKR